MKYALLLPLLAAAVLLAAPAQGYEISVKDYENLKNEQDMDVYMGGLGAGLLLANNRLQTKKQPALYCPPRDTVLRTDNFMKIVDSEIALLKKTDPGGWQKPEIGGVLLDGLIKTFPCPKK